MGENSPSRDQRIINKSLPIIIAISLSIMGCAGPTKPELMNNSDNMQIWEVSGPIDSVFIKYKECAEEYMRNRLRVVGYFYGPTAELSIEVDGLNKPVCLHFQLEEAEEYTLVTSWYANSGWKSISNKYKSLYPTKVIKGEP